MLQPMNAKLYGILILLLISFKCQKKTTPLTNNQSTQTSLIKKQKINKEIPKNLYNPSTYIRANTKITTPTSSAPISSSAHPSPKAKPTAFPWAELENATINTPYSPSKKRQNPVSYLAFENEQTPYTAYEDDQTIEAYTEAEDAKNAKPYVAFSKLPKTKSHTSAKKPCKNHVKSVITTPKKTSMLKNFLKKHLCSKNF